MPGVLFMSLGAEELSFPGKHSAFMFLRTGQREWEQWGHAALWRPPLSSTLGESSHSCDPLSHPPGRTTANELVPDKPGTTTWPMFPQPQVNTEGEVGLRGLESLPAPCWDDKPCEKLALTR